VPKPGLALEGLGWVPEGQLLGQVSEGTTAILARVRVEFEKGLAYVRDLRAGTSRRVKQVRNAAQFLRDVRRAEELGEAFVKQWRETLQKILLENSLPLNRAELGTWIHAHLEYAFDELAAAMKTYSPRAETTIGDLAKVLSDANELKASLQRANTPLLAFARQRPAVLKALNVTNERELVAFLKEMGYADPSKTLIGDLVSDGVLFNRDARRLISVDWTSGLGKYRFANEFEKILQAGGAGKDVQKLARRFLSHMYREYGLREAILEFVFDGWDTKVIEVMYQPFRLPN
jgi:hypothetical protein